MLSDLALCTHAQLSICTQEELPWPLDSKVTSLRRDYLQYNILTASQIECVDMCCECGVTRLPTNYCSAHVWKERGSKEDDEKGEGNVSIYYDNFMYILYICPVSIKTTPSLQGSDGITPRTLL